MSRTWMALVVGAMIGAAGISFAQHDHGGGKVTPLSTRPIEEKLAGEPASVTTIEVKYEPGEGTPPHRHAGPVFGYVLEGEFETALADQPARKLKAGETFYEPGGILHRVSRNPSDKGRTRVLAVMVHPRDAKELTVMEK